MTKLCYSAATKTRTDTEIALIFDEEERKSSDLDSSQGDGVLAEGASHLMRKLG